jgi:flagellar biosynthetic protein FliR
MLAEILPLQVFAFFLVFVRLGAVLMFIPGFGEPFIPVRIRLVLALTLTVALGGVVADTMPPLPDAPIQLLLLIAGELVIGALIGGAARMTMSALHVAGTVIAFLTSLGFALFVDPTQGTQGALVATFLNLFGLVLIFATGLHLVMIQALYDSYVLFTPGSFAPVGDFALLAIGFISGAFRVGMQMAVPFIVYGLVFYISLGILARLMPQFQVFFIALPLQIAIGLSILAVVLPALMMWFLNYYETTIAQFLVR